MVVFNVISPLFKGYPEIKVKNLQSQWADEAGSYCNLVVSDLDAIVRTDK